MIKTKLDFIKSLFHSRRDVFAIHWQKGNKSGYMPAYQFDPFMYQLHKRKGGNFKNYKDKSYLPLTDLQIQKHFNGEQLIGIYPLLQDNTSSFIAADFDKKDWIKESLKFMEVCSKYDIPSYLERSRSGKGGHVWIFFDQPYSAFRSRKIITKFLEEAGIFSVFNKGTSFDRLFPNQDFHSGKGLGNLIALPFYKPALEQGNSCFVDPRSDELKPYPNQWEFLSSIKKAPINQLDELFNLISSNSNSVRLTKNDLGKLQIVLKNDLRINRATMTPDLVSYLKEELNFPNAEYFIKKKTGKNTWDTPSYFRVIEESEQEVIIPRGFVGRLLRYCKQNKIDFEFLDQRKKQPSVSFSSSLQLRPHQEQVMKVSSQKDFGIISAPPGSGKTVIGLQIIAEKQQPALIVVHRKHLLEQWVERIQAFLGIPRNEIGKIGLGKSKIGKDITVALIQSLGKYLEKQKSSETIHSFGTIIIDECHHMPADTFRKSISKLIPYYQYGLTATPFRKGNDTKLIPIYLGDIIAEIRPEDMELYKRPRIIIRNTTLKVPFNPKTDTFETLSNILIHDSTRNRFILKDIVQELHKGKKVIIITERKEHIETLNLFLKQSFETITLSGGDSETSRRLKWKLLSNGDYQVLITTGQYFGEGSDLQNASCLFLVYPFSFKGKLIQYIGRVQRSETTPVIYDYRDHQIEYLNRLFLKRNKHYRHLDKQATLFDEQENIESSPVSIIDKKVKVPIDELDFRYGAVAFKYQVPKAMTTLEFEVENEDLRPEFDVMKPYFSKILKSKFIEAAIYAEFEDNELIALSATSTDIEKINREIIESVKFRFIEKEILGRHSLSSEALVDLNKLQEDQKNQKLYNSEEDLLDDILKGKNVKHHRQLKYLASEHENTVMKLRFVLSPFSFVFLLSGVRTYHLVLETLDTEEATYIWHFDRDAHTLKQQITIIDHNINLIRNEGRQFFLRTRPDNFSKIIHDYSDELKGFIEWKGLLDERIF